MDEIKKITQDEFNNIKTPFNKLLLCKDYYITLILYLLRNIEGLNFKGGTALNKIFLNYERLSEDIDYTLSRNLKEVEKEIIKTLNDSGMFEKITKDKSVDKFTRLVVHYIGFSEEKGLFL